MKKKIIIGIFLSLVLITAIVFILGVISTYNYEVANDDIMVGLGAVMIASLVALLFSTNWIYFTPYIVFS